MNTGNGAGHRERFIALWRSVDGTDPEGRWDALAGAYGEPVRHYHTLEHIGHCLRTFDHYRTLATDPVVAELSLWFHDIIYVPGAADNEARSAEHFLAVAPAGLSAERQQRVADHIVATTHRALPADGDAALVCDVDLSGIGAPWEDFIADSRRLCRESPLTLDRYLVAQRRFLAALLDRPRIYATTALHDDLEAGARDNMTRLVAQLDDGSFRIR